MFRQAFAEDIKGILEFAHELKDQNAKMSFVDYVDEDFLRLHLNDPLIFIYLAYDDDKVIALFRGIRGQGAKDHSVYVACAVKKEFRNKSLATNITNYALEDFKTKGILIARTKIYSWNKGSVATIKKCGFELSGRVFMHEYMSEIDDYIDDLIFHKKL